MLLFLGAGLFQTGIDKLIDKEILPLGIAQLWDTSAILDDSSTFGSLVSTLTGYRAHPSLTNLVAYVAYWAIVYLLLKRAARRPAATAGGRHERRRRLSPHEPRRASRALDAAPRRADPQHPVGGRARLCVPDSRAGVHACPTTPRICGAT